MCFVSCGSDDDDNDNNVGIDTSPVTLTAEQTKTIAGNVNKTVSANEFVAIVNNNVITGNHIGETIVTVNGKYNIPVTVIPRYLIMKDPITEWGASKATIKAKQTEGTLSKEESDMLAYTNCGDASAVGYSFDNGKLSSIVVLVSTSKMTAYTGYLKERFAFYPAQLADYTFVGMDSYTLDKAKTVVALSVYNANYLACVYMPADKFNSDSSAKAIETVEFDDL